MSMLFTFIIGPSAVASLGAICSVLETIDVVQVAVTVLIRKNGPLGDCVDVGRVCAWNICNLRVAYELI